MFTKRLLHVALSAAFLAVLSASAQERKDATPKGPAVGVYTFSGTISRVDADKRTVELRDARRGPGAEKDAGTRVGESKSPGGTMTFHLTEKAQVTLDGKPVTLASLKVGQFARVHTAPASTSGVAPKDRSAKEAVGAMTTADRIDAVTRAIDPKGTAGEKDKDR